MILKVFHEKREREKYDRVPLQPEIQWCITIKISDPLCINDDLLLNSNGFGESVSKIASAAAKWKEKFGWWLMNFASQFRNGNYTLVFFEGAGEIKESLPAH